MKIVLVQCPAWTTESPPYALALLSAVLGKNGHEVVCLDLNIELFKYCKKNMDSDSIINEKSWLSDFQGNVWYEGENISDFMKENSPLIEAFVDIVIEKSERIIGFSVQSTSRFFSLELAKRIKERDRNKIIIFGGFFCSRNCYGMDLLKNYDFIDHICFGEGEEAFLSLLKLIGKGSSNLTCTGFGWRDKGGRLIDGDNSLPIIDLDALPFADFSRFRLQDYTKRLLPISVSRGCVNRCSFCDQASHWQGYRTRSAKNVIGEIKSQLKKYPEIDSLFFNDYLINGDLKVLNEFCDSIIKENIKFSWCSYAVIRKEMTKELLHKIKLTGCTSLIYGVESGSNKVLKLMRKGYSAELSERILHDTFEAGICADFNIIVGFPGESNQELRETKEFVLRCKRYAGHIDINTCLILKGSSLFTNPELFGLPPIDFNKNFQLKWNTDDGLNTYEIRKARFDEIIQTIMNN